MSVRFFVNGEEQGGNPFGIDLAAFNESLDFIKKDEVWEWSNKFNVFTDHPFNVDASQVEMRSKGEKLTHDGFVSFEDIADVPAVIIPEVVTGVPEESTGSVGGTGQVN